MEDKRPASERVGTVIVSFPLPLTDTVEDSFRSQSEVDYKKYGISQDDIDKAIEEASSLTLDNARAILADYLIEHGEDMLIPQSFTDSIKELTARLNVSEDKIEQAVEVEGRLVAAVFHGNSVYREIRAIFSNVDDPDMPCGTVRAWVIGLIWAAGLAGLNQFFAPRNPTLTVSVYIAQLFSFPMGRFCAAILPTTVFLRASRFEFSLNPGPFSIKEHMLILTLRTKSYQICAMLALQITGFGLAGMIRRFLIYPPQMIWFFTLSQAALNNALHNQSNSHVHAWKISRFNFFFVVCGLMFLYYWLPGTIMPILTFFNWTTWIAPTSATLSILTGSYYFNLGLNPLLTTFDWNWFSGVVDPIIYPFFVVVQIVGSALVWAVLVVIPVFFTNTWYTAYLPINSWYAYDNTGNQYNFSRVVGPGSTLNETAYREYSPLFLPATFVLRYAVLLAVIPAVCTFTWLWYGKAFGQVIKQAIRRISAHQASNDVHSRLMSRYHEVPETWYLAVGVIGAAFGFATVYGWPTGAPGWTVPVTILLSIFFLIPIGVVYAISGYQSSLELLFDIIAGYAVHNRPAAYLLFRAYGLGILEQALFFAKDMKLAHYVKIPPRQVFASQIISSLVSTFVVLAVVNFQFSVKGMCNPQVNVHWVCGTAQTGFSSSLTWGLLGPSRMFTHVDALYWKIMLGLLAGLLWPVLWYLGKRAWPNSILRYAHPIVMMLGGVVWAPSNLSMFWGTLFFSYIFGVFIKDRWPGWWAKYALVLSSALTAGIVLSALVQFFAISNAGVSFPAWWGTKYHTTTCDFHDCRYMKLAKGETFGPDKWD
ncbi:OPT oligopeptide transporter protein-domain-containing protein [Trichoderma sp. SZMC 28011]